MQNNETAHIRNVVKYLCRLLLVIRSYYSVYLDRTFFSLVVGTSIPEIRNSSVLIDERYLVVFTQLHHTIDADPLNVIPKRWYLRL